MTDKQKALIPEIKQKKDEIMSYMRSEIDRKYTTEQKEESEADELEMVEKSIYGGAKGDGYCQNCKSWCYGDCGHYMPR